MSSIQDTLVKSGLDSSTAEIYLILAKFGEIRVPDILTKTDLSRATVYDSLTQLLAEGYLEYRKAGREAFYKIAHPGKLSKLMKDKKHSLNLLEGEFEKAIQQLTGAFNIFSHKPGVRFFEGLEGLKQIYNDVLSEKTDVNGIASLDPIHPDLLDWLDAYYVPERVKLGIRSKLIVPSTTWIKQYAERGLKELREIAIVVPEEYPIDIELMVYGKDKIAIISFGLSESVGMIIQSAAIHKSMDSFFRLAWLQAKKTSSKEKN